MTSNLDWEKLLGDSGVEKEYRNYHWEGSFFDYLDIVKKNPKVCRNAFQRMYDMILSYGSTSYVDYKKTLSHYNFFDDPIDHGKDAVFGLDVPLNKLVSFFKSAAFGYGTEKRVLLLHGPVGSAKSTIARSLKKGIERYSRTDDGALYTFKWVDDKAGKNETNPILGNSSELPCPMHEDPLRLIPNEMRQKLVDELNKENKTDYKIAITGDVCPACRYVQREFMKRYNGDFTKVLQNHVRVSRLILSEKDRIGIGTFQPKDEKNQDSTELTGDINYRKIAEYGSDSDPRAFN